MNMPAGVGFFYFIIDGKLLVMMESIPSIGFHIYRWAKESLLMRAFKALVAVIVLFTVSLSVFSKDFPIVHPNEISAKYGKPDRIKSTEYDKPRPPFVTRMLEYKKENVRFSFLPTAPVGTPPPYRSWYLLGTQDPRDNSVISAEEAARRMQGRSKK